MTCHTAINSRTKLERKLGVNRPPVPDSAGRSPSGNKNRRDRHPPRQRPAGFRFLFFYPHQWTQIFCTLTILAALFVLLSIK